MKRNIFDGKSAASTSETKKKYEQKFRDSWLEDPIFKSWIKKVRNQDGDFQPMCVPCNSKISCAKTSLLRHQETKGHKEAVSISSSLKKSNKKIESDEAVASTEIKIASFIVENNLSIRLSEELLALIRSICPTDSNLKKVSMGKQRTTNIIRQVLGFQSIREGCKLLSENKFSLVIDETTDRSTQTQLAILGVFFDRYIISFFNFPIVGEYYIPCKY